VFLTVNDMTTSWPGYERYREDSLHKSICGLWNSDGTILVIANNLPKQKGYQFGNWHENISVTLTPQELTDILNNPPSTVKHINRLVPGMFPSFDDLCFVAHEDGTIEIGNYPKSFGIDKPPHKRDRTISPYTIRLDFGEWKMILAGCLKEGKGFAETIGIYPLLGTRCTEETDRLTLNDVKG
jgi:hypothetical protein